MISDQEILQAAIKVFNDDFSAPLDSIAEKAGINRRTLYRRYKDREQLIQACKAEMMVVCKAAMNDAYHSEEQPLKKLEMMLYAGIDCNYKYAFLNKLQQREQPKLMSQTDQNDLEDNVKMRWRELIIKQQQAGIIDSELTVQWIFFLFDGMISTTITAMESGEVAVDDIKRFAWRSFAYSIGIHIL